MTEIMQLALIVVGFPLLAWALGSLLARVDRPRGDDAVIERIIRRKRPVKTRDGRVVYVVAGPLYYGLQLERPKVLVSDTREPDPDLVLETLVFDDLEV